MALISDQSQAIGEFLDWLHTNHDVFVSGVPRLLAEYFEIDLRVIDEEQRAMVKRLREMNSGE